MATITTALTILAANFFTTELMTHYRGTSNKKRITTVITTETSKMSTPLATTTTSTVLAIATTSTMSTPPTQHH